MITFRKSFLFGSLALLTACGEAVVNPPVSSFTDQPTIAFFNTANPLDTARRVRLRGTASAAGFVTGVEVSFDGGATWRDATLANSGFDVEWWVDATLPEISASTTILSRASSNAGGTEAPLPGFSCAAAYSATPGGLGSILAGGGTIYLSSGTGGAYSVNAPLSPASGMMVAGNGSGSSGTCPPTVLSAAPSFPRLFSLDGTGLSLARVQLKGGFCGLSASAPAGTLSLAECAFTGQGTASVVVAGGGVEFDRVKVSASSALSGGILLRDCTFQVTNSFFDGSGTGSPGLAYDSPGAFGYVGSTLFSNCGVSLSAGRGSAVIASSLFTGVSPASNGISFWGTSGSPVLRHSKVQGFPGYGVEIRAGAAPTLWGNVISANQNAGVFLTGDFRYAPLPDLGSYGSLTSGSNYLFANKATDSVWGEGDYQVYVGRTSLGGGRPIPAENNWWQKEGSPTIAGTEAGAEMLVLDFDDLGLTALPDIDVSPLLLTAPPTP